MAEVGLQRPFSTMALRDSYLPSLPATVPRTSTDYTRANMLAPLTALMGVSVDGRQPDKFRVSPRCRERKQVGSTNRWRIPYSLGSDLLGVAQATRALNMPYNKTMVKIMTGEGPQRSFHLDTNESYHLRQFSDRPVTLPAPHQQVRASTTIHPKKLPSTAPNLSSGPHPAIRSFMPNSARPATPIDIFLYHSKKNENRGAPDVLLKCLGIEWELHRLFFQKSRTLSNLLHSAENPRPQKYYRNPASETLDQYISRSQYYSNEYQDMSNRLSTIIETGDDEVENKDITHPSMYTDTRVRSMTELKVDVRDPFITKQAMAVALGNLYHDDTEVEVFEVAKVLACASFLKFKDLEDGCAQVMMNNMRPNTICAFYVASTRYNRDDVVTACERWLELNLIPQLATQIHLRDLPSDILLKVLKSNRLFTYNEYSLYKVLSYWLFLQINSHLQLMPSHSSVVSFFNSLPKTGAFIEREEGQKFAPLFMALRLHGILENVNIQEIQQMNIIPQSWIVQMLSEHYHALQGGGDMSMMNNYNSSSIRQGFVIDNNGPPFHSEIFSVHGFHFEIKAIRKDKRGTYTFLMQRLKPTDPQLTFRQCERQTFSARPDRDVRYNIRVQTIHNGHAELYTTGTVAGRFGLGDKTCQSETLHLSALETPIYVSFSLMFPQS